MLREQLDHVIKKRQTGADARTAIAIEVELNPHVSLFRLALNSRLAGSVLFFDYEKYLFVRRAHKNTADEQGHQSPTTYNRNNTAARHQVLTQERFRASQPRHACLLTSQH